MVRFIQLGLCCRCCFKKRDEDEEEQYRMERTLSASKDLYYFDMGYNIAFT